MEENNEVEVGRTEQFMNEVINYLYSKFDGIPDNVVQDVAAYVANRFGIALIDISVEQEQRYIAKLNKVDEQYRELWTEYHKLQARKREV